MRKWVVDASVAIRWFIPGEPDEPDADKAVLLLGQAASADAILLQPPHWVSEVAGVLVRRTPASAADNIADLLLFDFCATVGDARIYRRAMALAQRLDHHVFDTLYHAVALEENATLVTADERYYEKAAPLGAIMLLKDFPLPEDGA
jgi:predicted nucleic acid-binding protein